MARAHNLVEMTDTEFETRSVLMRLFHSYWFEEPFYPARFVNGCAPSMEANGWIERVGEGWRITDEGIDAWAEMNRRILTVINNQKSFFVGHQYTFLRDRLSVGAREDMSTICKKEGCGQPRMVSKTGVVQTFCETHQREYWAETKRNAYQKANEPTAKPKQPKRETAPKSAGAWVDGEPDTIKHEVVEVAAAVKPIDLSYGIALSSGNKETPITVAVDAVKHDCNQCEAKAVVEALRAKSPKLAKLIDAMQAEVEAARDLGI